MTFLTAQLSRLYQPVAGTIGQYSFAKLKRDLLAGSAVAALDLPQAMAYATIAGVPVQYGIYTSIIQGIIGALLSSSQHLMTGPTNTQSLLIASAVARLAKLSGQDYVQLVFALTLLKGLIQLGLYFARLGDMVRYVSRSVVVGVAAGAGILIAAQQLSLFLGLDISGVERRLPGVLGVFERLAPLLGQTNPKAVWIGLMCLAIVIGARAISPLVPGSLLAVIAGAIVVVAAGWTGTHQIDVVGSVTPALPHLVLPHLSWANAEALVGGAAALAILGLIESVAIVKTVAGRTGERISADQEFLAQGLANTASSFFGCIPGSASFSRVALGFSAGGATRFAAVFDALLICGAFFILAPQAANIPRASLAAILFVVAYGLIDWRYIIRIGRTSRSDAFVCLATLLATLLSPLEFAVFIGIFLNIGLYVRKTSRLHLAEMVESGDGRFTELPLRNRRGERPVVFLQLEGELFFGVADELQDRLEALGETDVRVVVLRLKRTHSVDSTVLHVLEQFVQRMRDTGRHVVLCGLRPELMNMLRVYGLLGLVGEQNVFEAGQSIYDSARRALLRARELAGTSIDTSSLDARLEREVMTYEI